MHFYESYSGSVQNSVKVSKTDFTCVTRVLLKPLRLDFSFPTEKSRLHELFYTALLKRTSKVSERLTATSNSVGWLLSPTVKTICLPEFTT